jgi:hypothetical protein
VKSPAAFLYALLSVGLVCFLVACHSDRRESFYPSLSEADKDGATTRGWIPEFLPGSSHSIHEVHDLSPSTEWGAFEFAPSDSEILRKSLKHVDALPQRMRRVPNPGVSWWPSILDGTLDIENIHRSALELYLVETADTSVTTNVSLFAIDWPKGRGYFFCTRK